MDDDIMERLLALRRELDKITGRVETELDKVSHVAAVIDEIASEPRPAVGINPTSTPARRSTAEEKALREAARAGAVSLAMAWNVDGSAEVRINGGAPFHLQAKPAALLSIIAAPGGVAADDGLIGWRSWKVKARTAR